MLFFYYCKTILRFTVSETGKKYKKKKAYFPLLIKFAVSALIYKRI